MKQRMKKTYLSSLSGSYAVDCPSGAEELCRGELLMDRTLPCSVQMLGRDRRSHVFFSFESSLIWPFPASLWHGSFVALWQAFSCNI